MILKSQMVGNDDVGSVRNMRNSSEDNASLGFQTPLMKSYSQYNYNKEEEFELSEQENDGSEEENQDETRKNYTKKISQFQLMQERVSSNEEELTPKKE